MPAFVVRLSLLGLPVTLSCSDSEVAATIGRLWSPFLVGRDETRLEPRGAPVPGVAYEVGRAVLRRDGVALGTGGPWRTVLARLAQDLNQHVLTHDRLPLAVHAGCVTDGRRTVAWPAASTVGKSTFTAACAAAGWQYVTDEGVVLVDGARVAPYPRPLGLCGVARERYRTPASEDVDGEVLVPPADLGAVRVTDRPLLTDLLLLERRPGAVGLTLLPEPRVAAVPVLLTRSFNAFRHQADAVARVSALAGGLRVWRAVYQDAWTAAPLLQERLEQA